jgi:hypothetical protein
VIFNLNISFDPNWKFSNLRSVLLLQKILFPYRTIW